MSKKQVIILLIFFIFLVFLLSKPYNQLCKSVNWCEPVSFSYYLPSFKGEKSIDFIFEAISDDENIEFKVAGVNSAQLYSGEKITVKYQIKNLLQEAVEVSPMRYFNEMEILKNLEFYECLCFESHKIEAGESKIISLKFKVKKSLDQDLRFKDKDKITLGYRIM